MDVPGFTNLEKMRRYPHRYLEDHQPWNMDEKDESKDIPHLWGKTPALRYAPAW